MGLDDHAFKARFSPARWIKLKAYALMAGCSVNDALGQAVDFFLEAQAADPEVRARLDANLEVLQAAVKGLLGEASSADGK